jgi:hypothetical protein
MTARVLVAPLGAVGLVSNIPSDLGGDACSAADGDGNLFFVGGSASNETGYVYNQRFEVFGFGPGAFEGVVRPGCAAFRGAVAAVGGCDDTGISEVHLIQADGTRTTFNANLDVVCGAMAAPAADGGVWVVDGDGTVTLTSADNRVVLNRQLSGAPEAVEVTAAGSLVVLIDGSAFRLGRDDTRGPDRRATALGRRGEDVLILDGGDVEVVTEDDSPKPVRGGAAAADRFVLLSDDTFVGLQGTTITVIRTDLSQLTLISQRAHSTISALAGDTVLLSGGAGAGFDGFSRR